MITTVFVGVALVLVLVDMGMSRPVSLVRLAVLFIAIALLIPFFQSL